MDFSIGGLPLFLVLLVTIVGIIGLIFVMKSVFKKRSESGIAGDYKDQASRSPIANRTKYARVDVFSLSPTFFTLGLALSLGLTVLAFAWTKRDDTTVYDTSLLEIEEDIEIEPPRTAEPPPPPPPPPPPVIEEVPDEEILEDPPEFESQDVEEETAVVAPEPIKQAAPPPPPPPPKPKEPEVEEIFKVVEQMPRFPGCENEATEEARKSCAEQKLLDFIYKNIKYPAIARENGVEGVVVVTFVVEKDGSVTDARVVRDIGAQCGEEAMRVVQLMNKQNVKWVPGKQRGRPVRVQFNLPVRFKLEQ